MQPTDLAHLAVPSDPQWHPDGRRLVFVETRVDLDDDRYTSRLMLSDGEVVRSFTHGVNDARPRWSPDGRTVAFLRKQGDDDDAVSQLALMPSDGGEAEVVTDLPLGVSDLAWSPDGRQLIVVGTEWISDLAELDGDERRRRPRRITRLTYRFDDMGWVYERRKQLWLVDAVDRAVEPRRLTDLPDDVVGPAWHPSGDRIVALSRPEPVDDAEPYDEIVTVEVPSGDVRRTGTTGAWAWVGYDPEGVLHTVGLRDPFDWPAPQRIWRLEETAGEDGEGQAELVDLTGYLDRDVSPGSPGIAPDGPRFVADGLLTGFEDRGHSWIVRIGRDGVPPDAPAVPDVVVGGPRSVTGFAVRPDGDALAVTWTDATTPGELSTIIGIDGTTSADAPTHRQVTSYGDQFRDRVHVLPTERWSFDRDGVEIDAWSVLPDGFLDAGAGEVPVLINVHGGPTGQYGAYFFDEFQVEAGAGYLVVGTNPRGSSGRGTEWCRAVVGVWADSDPVDLLDLRAVLDAVVARYPQADPQRIGIMGGSYGGFAVARILADDHRFASAIVERGLLEWGSFSGTSDIGPFFDRMFLAASLPDGAAPHHAASPVFTAGRVTTPTLVIHSEHDWRCPIEQAERYFAALKRAGVVTELLRFPDEGHELSRSGSPKHRIERYEAVLDWHARYLKAAGAQAPDEAAPVPPAAPEVTAPSG